MKSIAFIVPYFGSFNNYFPYWLLSCAKNESVDWFIITDNNMEYNVPTNVHVVPMTFKECKNKIQQHFDFPINLEKPYKLCDFRPAFGCVFNDLVKDFDFWGYCDVDLVWGNVRSFLTEDLLNSIDKFSHYGHCSVYRNSKEMNEIFKKEYKDIPSYKEVFSSSLAYIFDEKIMKYYCRKEHMRVAEKNNYFFDCSYDFYQMNPTCYQRNFFHSDSGYILKWCDGELQLIGCLKNELLVYPIMYGHFQKRKMNVKTTQQHVFYICDSTFCDVNENLTADLISRMSPKKCIYSTRIAVSVNRILGKIFPQKRVCFYSYSKKQKMLIDGVA